MSAHLIRISEVFSSYTREILEILAAEKVKRLGSEYYLFQTEHAERITNSPAARFIRWHIPVEHSWPCNPEKMDGFIEKAAQTIYYKFESLNPQTMLVGQLDPSSTKRYYKALASNFRGRALQVFEFPERAPKAAEDQNSSRKTLFCMLGKEGLFCGMASPKESNGFYPGGTKYISQNAEDTISRAGAKVAEALHYLGMFRPDLPEGSHWLELGASPGGMTSELLKRNYRVTAIDRAPLDARLNAYKALTFLRDDVSEFIPPRGARYDAILSDMNGPPRQAIAHVTRLTDFLNPGGIVIFTLKTTGAESIPEIDSLEKEVLEIAEKAGLTFVARTHLTYNRQEFTLFFEKA
ncbi:SAM-dependent methyltransferase [Luteolibacter algae]|uniref:SAM-dependent methyltransferase n=1 Tax=Luteolibacter algae TaxID=454151 RepID=A0ABW5D7Q1_9BACT